MYVCMYVCMYALFINQYVVVNFSNFWSCSLFETYCQLNVCMPLNSVPIVGEGCGCVWILLSRWERGVGARQCEFVLQGARPLSCHAPEQRELPAHVQTVQWGSMPVLKTLMALPRRNGMCVTFKGAIKYTERLLTCVLTCDGTLGKGRSPASGHTVGSGLRAPMSFSGTFVHTLGTRGSSVRCVGNDSRGVTISASTPRPTRNLKVLGMTMRVPVGKHNRRIPSLKLIPRSLDIAPSLRRWQACHQI
jgi:hypothetical protein